MNEQKMEYIIIGRQERPECLSIKVNLCTIMSEKTI